MSYLDADAMVICIDGTNTNSLKQSEMYVLQSKKAKVPIILCVTKIDKGVEISDSELKSFRNRHNINAVIKVSAYDSKSIEEGFERIINTSINESFIETTACMD